VEWKFATLYGRVRAMLNGARLTKELHDRLWTKWVIHSKDVLWLDQNYREWKGLGINTTVLDNDDDDDDDLLINLEALMPPPLEPPNDGTVEVPPTHGPTNPRFGRVMHNLVDHNNPAAPVVALRTTRSMVSFSNQPGRDDAVNDTASVLINQFHNNFAMVVTSVSVEDAEITKDGDPKISPSSYKDIYDAPNSYDRAWDHEDPWQQSKWREAIMLEFKKMEAHKVWIKVKCSTMQPGKHCVKHK
jgi:hypothetical protein